MGGVELSHSSSKSAQYQAMQAEHLEEWDSLTYAGMCQESKNLGKWIIWDFISKKYGMDMENGAMHSLEKFFFNNGDKVTNDIYMQMHT